MSKKSHGVMVHVQMQFHLYPYKKYDHRCTGLHETIIDRFTYGLLTLSFTQNQTLNVESTDRN
jgi:hypothetical protein